MSLPTARQVLAAKGLAKEFADDGVTPARGRFSREAVAYLETLTEGVDYIGVQAVKAAKAPAKPKVAKVTAPKVSLPADVDPKEVREWAAENGHAVNARGRLPLPVIAAFVKADGSRTGQRARPVVVSIPTTRKEREAFVVENGNLIAITKCADGSKGGCGKRVNLCTHPAPIAPHWLSAGIAGKPMSLVKPVV